MNGERVSNGTWFLFTVISPKYSVAQVVWYIKGKSAIHIARDVESAPEILLAKIFGHVAISFRQLVVMRPTIRQYILNQEKREQQLEQMKLPR